MAHILDSFQIHPESGEAIYAQLANFLRHAIQSGALKPGDRMLGENEIVKQLGISRTTVRLAFDALASEGLIARYRGKGTFVAQKKLRRSINYLYNFTENIRMAGATASSHVIACDVETENIAQQDALNLRDGDGHVFVLKRVRMANAVPLVYEQTYVPYYLCQGIEAYDFTEHSLYATLRGEFGLNICRAAESIDTVILPKSVCALLECKSGQPGFKVERFAYLSSGYACEHTVSYTRGDRCSYHMDLLSNFQTREHNVDFERRMILDTAPTRLLNETP